MKSKGLIDMKAKLDGRYIKLDLYELAEELTSEERLLLCDSLALQNDVIAYVTQQIVDGATDAGSWSGRACITAAEPKPERGLDWACREVALKAGGVQAEEIRRLQQALKAREEEVKGLRERNEQLYFQLHGR